MGFEEAHHPHKKTPLKRRVKIGAGDGVHSVFYKSIDFTCFCILLGLWFQPNASQIASHLNLNKL